MFQTKHGRVFLQEFGIKTSAFFLRNILSVFLDIPAIYGNMVMNISILPYEHNLTDHT